MTLKYKKKCCHLKCSLAKVRAEFVVLAFCFIGGFLLSQMVQSQNDKPIIFLNTTQCRAKKQISALTFYNSLFPLHERFFLTGQSIFSVQLYKKLVSTWKTALWLHMCHFSLVAYYKIMR